MKPANGKGRDEPKRDPERLRKHIHDANGNVFLSQERMSRIRWEQSVRASCLKRKGKHIKDKSSRRFDCTCGSEDCLGNIVDMY
jgi:hypothetical protein